MEFSLTWLSPDTVDRSKTARVLLNKTLWVPIRALNMLYSIGSAATQVRAASGPLALQVTQAGL
jgi:hypothetical protein